MFVPNIPRRKLYEASGELEDALLNLQYLLFKESHFDEYITTFNKEGYKKLQISFNTIRALLVLFFEHKQYESEEEYELDFKTLLTDPKEVARRLKKNKNLPFAFHWTSRSLTMFFEKHKVIEHRGHAKKLQKEMHRFNAFLPKILELRRDHMK